MPILLYPGMKIGQLCFFQLSSPARAPYGQGASGSRYQGQRGPTASRSYQGFSCIEIPADRLSTIQMIDFIGQIDIFWDVNQEW